MQEKGVFLVENYLEGFWKQDLDQTLMSLNREQKNGELRVHFMPLLHHSLFSPQIVPTTFLEPPWFLCSHK